VALQFRRGTAADVASESFVPLIGEPVFLTDEQKLYIGDGLTQGGISLSGATDLSGLTSVELISESTSTIASYEVTSSVATVSFTLSHNYYNGLQITIADSPVTALNGTHTITATPTANQISFALTTADVANTSTSGSVTPIVADGSVLAWDATNSQWEDLYLGLNELSDVDLTTAPTSGQILSFNGTNFVPDDFEIVNDTTPQLGGSLDVNGNDLVSATNGDIGIAPDGTGKLTVKGNATGGSGQIALNCEQNTHAVVIQGPAHAAAADYTLTLPTGTGSAGQALTTNGSGTLSWADAAPSALHTAFIFSNNQVVPAGTIASSLRLGQNYGTWTEQDDTYAFGPSSATYNPTLTGITFDAANGHFEGFAVGRYQVTCDINFEINNVTPTFGSNLISALVASNPSATFTYASPLHHYGVLPYASYGSAAHSFSITLNLFIVFEDATPANNELEVFLDQDVGPSFYVTDANLIIVKVADI